MVGIWIGTLVILLMLLCFIAFLVTTQRSEDQRTMKTVLESSTRERETAETTLRLVLTSSNSQSADMTDLVDRVTKNQTKFLELVTLGRELPTNDSFVRDSNSNKENEEPDPYENMPWPDNINQALIREMQMDEEERNQNHLFATSLQPHSMQPESPSENNSNGVTITPA